VHPHGDFYAQGVPPGKTHIYTWQVPERAGPGPNDPSSVVWLYHSHADEPKGVGSGLVGVILISRKGAAGPAGRPTDVDREFVTLFMIVDENTSWYLQHNIATYTSDPKHVEKLENSPSDHLWAITIFSVPVSPSPISEPLATASSTPICPEGERVRWYVVKLGERLNLHTPHWHGFPILGKKQGQGAPLPVVLSACQQR
jgi:hypothetical protein